MPSWSDVLVRIILAVFVLPATLLCVGFVYDGFTLSRATLRPMIFYTGWILLAADVVALNRLFRRRGVGPVDRFFRWISTRRWGSINELVGWLIAIAFLALAGLAIEAVGDFYESGGVSTIVKDPSLAKRLQNSDRLFYAADKQGELIWFHLNPDVVRKFRAHGISVGGGGDTPHGLPPVPGVLPLVLLTLMVGSAVMRIWVRNRIPEFVPRSEAPLTVLQFGLMQFFVVGWYVSAQFGVFGENNSLHVEWALTAALLLICGACLQIAICHKLYNAELDPLLRTAWHSFFFAVQTIGFAGAAFVGPSIRPTPMWAWTWCYLFLSVLLGVLSIPNFGIWKAPIKGQ